MKRYISKCLIGLTILATTTWANVARADWVRVLTDKAENAVFYIETSTIQSENGRYYFWSSIVPENYEEFEEIIDFGGINMFVSTDCSAEDFRVLQYEFFDTEGNTLFEGEMDTNAPKLSRGEIALKNFVCKG